MPSPPNSTPLGLFYGDEGGPAATPPTSASQKNCPFLDPEENAFCTLDGTLCPFVGFSYSKCKKYTNNLNKSVMRQGSVNFTPKGEPPRLESLTEAKAKKKANPPPVGDVDAINNAFAQASVRDTDIPGEIPKNAPKRATTRRRTSPPQAKGAQRIVVKPTGKDTAPRATKGKSVVSASPRKKVEEPKEAEISDQEIQTNLRINKKLQKDQQNLVDIILGLAQVAADDKAPGKWSTEGQNLFYSAIAQLPVKEYSSIEKLRKARIADANVIASVLSSREGGNIDRHPAIEYAKGAVEIINRLAGDKPVTNPEERNRSISSREAHGDMSGAWVVHGVPDRPTTVGPISHGDVAAAVAPNTGVSSGLGTEENPPLRDDIINRYNRLLARGKVRQKAPDLHQTPGETKETPPTPKRAGKPVSAFAFTPTITDDPAVGPTVARGHAQLGADKPYSKEVGGATSGYMNYEQFHAYLKTLKHLSPQDKEIVFAGYIHAGKHPDEAIKDLDKMAEKLAKKKAYLTIAKMKEVFSSRVNDIHQIKANQHLFQRQWEANLETLRKTPIGDREAIKMYDRQKLDAQKSEALREKTASVLTRMMDNLYTLETKTVRVGDQEVTALLREITLPIFTKSDYEVMRMSEQMGLFAIHKTHQYGRQYGKWNTWHLFLRNIVAPLLLAFNGHGHLIEPLLKLWPTAWFDQFYAAYIAPPLPKLKSGEKSTTMLLSRDDRFLASQKMANPTTQKRLMKDWDKDAMLPPDTAISNTRWYPTTKMPWTKLRHKALTQQHEKLTKPERLPKYKKQSFLRR